MEHLKFPSRTDTWSQVALPSTMTLVVSISTSLAIWILESSALSVLIRHLEELDVSKYMLVFLSCTCSLVGARRLYQNFPICFFLSTGFLRYILMLSWMFLILCWINLIYWFITVFVGHGFTLYNLHIIRWTVFPGFLLMFILFGMLLVATWFLSWIIKNIYAAARLMDMSRSTGWSKLRRWMVRFSFRTIGYWSVFYENYLNF